MIYSITGTLENKQPGKVVVNAAGVGYELLVPVSVYEALPAVGEQVKLLTYESFAMYSGGTTLYGFLSEEQKNIYMAIKDFVPSTGPKKALEYLDKASKSLPDFRRAIYENDPRLLVGIFGFTKKSAEKIIVGLKDKVDRLQVSGMEKFAPKKQSTINEDAVEALIALGYKPLDAREMVKSTHGSSIEQIIKEALKMPGNKV